MQWHDQALPKFFSELIGDLRDEVWRLKGGAGQVAGTEHVHPVVLRLEKQQLERCNLSFCKIN